MLKCTFWLRNEEQVDYFVPHPLVIATMALLRHFNVSTSHLRHTPARLKEIPPFQRLKTKYKKREVSDSAAEFTVAHVSVRVSERAPPPTVDFTNKIASALKMLLVRGERVNKCLLHQ